MPASWVGQALGGQAVPGTAGKGQGPGLRPLQPCSSEKKEMPAFLCKLSCPGVRSKGSGVRAEGEGMFL